MYLIILNFNFKVNQNLNLIIFKCGHERILFQKKIYIYIHEIVRVIDQLVHILLE